MSKRALASLRTLPPAEPRGEATSVELDGELYRAYVGEPVAVALFAEGARLLARSPKYHRPRGLFCGNGHCGSCPLRIGGRPSARACMTPVVPGLRCERQNAFPDAEIDVLAAADWLFPGGMDHHRLMTGSRLGNDLFVKLVRRLGGSGTLPDAERAHDDDAPELAYEERTVDVAIVGAGPAGLSAARAVAEARPGARVLLLDDQARPGGSLLAEPDGVATAERLASAARAAGVELATGADAIGVYPPEHPEPQDARLAPGVLAVAHERGLLALRARRFVYATGAYEQNLPFADADRPGVLAARAVGRLAFQWGVAPGQRLVLVADDNPPSYLERLVAGLAARGVTVERARADDLPKLDLDRDVIAIGTSPAPASELPRQHGAHVVLDLSRGGFCVEADASGAIAAGGAVFVAGDVTGYLGPQEAAAAGARVGRALAEDL